MELRRKIVKHGPSSLTVSLPMHWVKNNNLKNGDEVEVLERPRELVISGEGKREAKEITITLSSKNPFVKRLFNTPYLHGYDIINVKFDSYIVMEKILQCVNAWRSFEVIEQRENFCKLKSIAEAKPEELDAMIVRMFNICDTVLEELLLFIKKDDLEALKRILLLDSTMTGIDLFCRRVINTGKGIEIEKAGSVYSIVRILEEISDLARDIANRCPKIRMIHKQEFTKIVELSMQSLVLLRKIRYKGEVELMYEYKELKNQLRARFDKDHNFNSEEMFFFMTLRHLIYELHDLSGEVLLWVKWGQ
ncbi:MAG: AbrB/MazE/SpoVT family DNA-binding domain-containing protein [Candidatus Woesearchaeota archaeon]